MKKLLLPLLLVLALTIASASALAETTSGKGRPTPDPDPTEVPDFGDLYGDLYVILRAENGAPIYDANGCIQPIASEDLANFPLEVEIQTDGDPLVITAFPGEPFSLAYYTDPEGDLVECELTETMAQWVQAVDFGRLNLGRAPKEVIDHALDEAINKMNLACAMDFDPSGRIMLEIEEICGDENVLWTTIDAPAENLALYIKMMTDGDWIIPEETQTSRRGGDPGVVEYRPVLSPEAIAMIANFEGGRYANLVLESSTTADLDTYDLLLAASLMAGAGDKFGAFTLDMVVYINSIYGINSENAYFDFSGFQYSRSDQYGLERGSQECPVGQVYVLQPVEGESYFEPGCQITLDVVHFNDYSEDFLTQGVDSWPYDANIRGFTQAADDSLQVLEYVHNYSVPEDLYAED